ncbi:MAG: hypothetical protein G01um101431_523 [Parcubacteria group bacterium Gr01-1014_31]|nr:MAG: hypothetical protein G01um101431_523 [Parcubacteria group bacterium Gr01-1014_31]
MRKFYLLYYAESGRMTGMYSELRKAFGRAPEPLLQVTHDVMGDMRLSWQTVSEQLSVPVEHYFRDQIPAPLEDFLHRSHAVLPAVVGLREDGNNVLVCTREQIAACQGKPEALAELLKTAVAESKT